MLLLILKTCLEYYGGRLDLINCQLIRLWLFADKLIFVLCNCFPLLLKRSLVSPHNFSYEVKKHLYFCCVRRYRNLVV